MGLWSTPDALALLNGAESFPSSPSVLFVFPSLMCHPVCHHTQLTPRGGSERALLYHSEVSPQENVSEMVGTL